MKKTFAYILIILTLIILLINIKNMKDVFEVEQQNEGYTDLPPVLAARIFGEPISYFINDSQDRLPGIEIINGFQYKTENNIVKVILGKKESSNNSYVFHVTQYETSNRDVPKNSLIFDLPWINEEVKIVGVGRDTDFFLANKEGDEYFLRLMIGEKSPVLQFMGRCEGRC